MSDPRQLEQYRQFVDIELRVGRDDGYLFDAPRCRFWPEGSDELHAPPGARVVKTQQGAAVQLPGGAELAIQGVDFDNLRLVFSELPCSYSRLTVQLGAAAAAFIQQAFSRVLFAPLAVAELELRLPAVEVVRFPGSPYEVVRQYWQNVCAVRDRLDEVEAPGDVAALRGLLLELHELLLLGEQAPGKRRSFYLPASLLGQKRPNPGSFYEIPTTFERRGADTVLTGGARVSVPLLGGVHYWQLLADSVDDAGALSDERRLEVDGLDLGCVVRARAEDETESRPWFLPPRPLTDAHFEALLGDLNASQRAVAAGNAVAALAALGAFHYRFVRLHPLPSGNQSLAMCFVNRTLRQLFGIGIPHLLLDQLALRFELPAYQQLFARAARAWCAPFPSAAERQRQLARMRSELEQFVTALAQAPSLLEARAMLSMPPESGSRNGVLGAELALITS